MEKAQNRSSETKQTSDQGPEAKRSAGAADLKEAMAQSDKANIEAGKQATKENEKSDAAARKEYEDSVKAAEEAATASAEAEG